MKRILEWHSMTGWEAVTEYDLRDAAASLEPPINPRGKLLSLARALVASPEFNTRFGGVPHGEKKRTPVEPEISFEQRIRKLGKRVA